MPIFVLDQDITFPPAELASQEGIVAVGGDLSPQRLLNAYANGIFPWYSEGEPILWWSPSPRMVLFPKEVHISRSMKRLLNKNPFSLTFDRNFREVIENCRLPRKKQPSTWITEEMRDAYVRLHELGFAHSAEVWQDKQLVGGIYGISLGKCFFGESMFSKKSNTSKFVFIKLAQQLVKMEFLVLDCQVPSEHLKSLGARAIPRKDYLSLLKQGLKHKTLVGNWGFPGGCE
jgi:leucyl/phenylalanyl-tRNA--protein transferase